MSYKPQILVFDDPLYQKDFGSINQANGLLKLDTNGLVPTANMPSSIVSGLTFVGQWDASTNTPSLTTGIFNQGQYYRVSVEGSTELSGITDWKVGDWAIRESGSWSKVDNSETVTKVNGYVGDVTLRFSDFTDSILSSYLADSAVTSSKLADSSVTTAKLYDLAVTSEKLDDFAVTSDKLDDLAVTSEKLDDLAVTTEKLADSAVTTEKLADSAVTETKIADANVSTAKLAALAVTTDKVIDQAITNEKLGDLAVTESKISDSAVTTTKVANGTITTEKLADLAVTEGKIVDENVSTAKLANSAVTTIKIADGTITNEKVTDDTLQRWKFAPRIVKQHIPIGNPAVTLHGEGDVKIINLSEHGPMFSFKPKTAFSYLKLDYEVPLSPDFVHSDDMTFSCWVKLPHYNAAPGATDGGQSLYRFNHDGHSGASQGTGYFDFPLGNQLVEYTALNNFRPRIREPGNYSIDFSIVISSAELVEGAEYLFGRMRVQYTCR